MTIVDSCTDMSINQLPSQFPITCIQSPLPDFPLRYLPILEHTPNGVRIPVKAPVPIDLYSMLRRRRRGRARVDTVPDEREDKDETCEGDEGR